MEGVPISPQPFASQIEAAGAKWPTNPLAQLLHTAGRIYNEKIDRILNFCDYRANKQNGACKDSASKSCFFLERSIF